MEDTTPDTTLIPRRKSAKAASDAIAGQLGSDSGSEADVELSKGKRRAHRQLNLNLKKPRTHAKSAPSPQPASGNITPRPQLAISTHVVTDSTSNVGSSNQTVAEPFEGASTTAPNQLAQIAGLEDLSDLTSLSSDENPTSPDDVVPRHKLLAKPFPMSAFDEPIFEATTLIPTLPKSPTRIPKATTSKASSSKPSTSAHAKPKTTTKPNNKNFKLNSYVWVLVKLETLQVHNDRVQGEEKGLWWPGKVERCSTSDDSLQVRLFGEGFKTVQIPSPSKDGIVPQSTSFSKIRFKHPTYVFRRALSVNPGTSINKQDGDEEDTERKWKSAVNNMKRDAGIIIVDDSCSDDVGPLSSSDDEDLPIYIRSTAPTSKPISAPTKPVFSEGNSKGIVKKTAKGKKRGKTTSIDFRDRAVEEPDVLLEIPGELVLARDKAQTNIYWPARIEAFVPAPKPGRPGRYTVTWVDSSRQDVPREWFYIFSDPEFATCRIGKYDSFFVEKEDDPDEDDLFPPEEHRSPSPVILDPPPSQEDFKNLSIREQFAYTKEVLQAILNGTYLPSRQKHDDFVKGGKWRKNVTNSAAMWGLMDPKDVKVVDKLVQKWCLTEQYEDHMDIMEHKSPELIDLERDQVEANLDRYEPPGLPKPPPALGDEIVPESTVVENFTAGVDDVREESQSAEQSLPTFTSNHPQSAETTLLSTSADDTGAKSTTSDPASIDKVHGEAELDQSVRAAEMVSADYVYPDSALRFESPTFPRLMDPSPPSDMPSSSFATLVPGSSQSKVISAVFEAASSPPPLSHLASTFTTRSTGDEEISDLTAMEDDRSVCEVAVTAPQKRAFVPFEALAPLVQIEYCCTILVPEAVRQILLWRSGDRTQVNLLTPKEEQILYDKGTRLLVERDWVFDVVRLREKKVTAMEAMRVKSLKANGKSLSMPMKNTHIRNGSSSRLKRTLSVQNYLE